RRKAYDNRSKKDDQFGLGHVVLLDSIDVVMIAVKARPHNQASAFQFSLSNKKILTKTLPSMSAPAVRKAVNMAG
ncbi:hypothetical protein RZS08_16950, partial [Arthrospira platensis SPKY1]|nr:hypothetical protein [Arthrospira platensis SPKY1]